jgi:hypothetical protein
LCLGPTRLAKTMLSSYVAVLVALCACGLVASEVTVLRAVQTIYDRSPKLRIKGTGFDADEHDITLELGATGQSSLRVDKDYLISKDPDGEGIILKLLSARRYEIFQHRILCLE